MKVNRVQKVNLVFLVQNHLVKKVIRENEVPRVMLEKKVLLENLVYVDLQVMQEPMVKQ